MNREKLLNSEKLSGGIDGLDEQLFMGGSFAEALFSEFRKHWEADREHREKKPFFQKCAEGC